MKDLCKFFKNATDHPDRIIKDISVRDYLRARAHLRHCEKCAELVDMVVDSSPQPGISFGYN